MRPCLVGVAEGAGEGGDRRGWLVCVWGSISSTTRGPRRPFPAAQQGKRQRRLEGPPTNHTDAQNRQGRPNKHKHKSWPDSLLLKAVPASSSLQTMASTNAEVGRSAARAARRRRARRRQLGRASTSGAPRLASPLSCRRWQTCEHGQSSRHTTPGQPVGRLRVSRAPPTCQCLPMSSPSVLRHPPFPALAGCSRSSCRS